MYVPTTVEAWDIPDPGGLALEQVRPIRDEIEARVRELVETRIEEIRSDSTAHRFRLRHLIPKLADEFEGTRTPEEIRACADAVLSRYDDDAGDSYTQVLAYRRTRECLQQDACDALAGVNARTAADEPGAAAPAARDQPAVGRGIRRRVRARRSRPSSRTRSSD